MTKRPTVARTVFAPPALEGPTLQLNPASRWQAYWNARRLLLQLQRYPTAVLQGLSDELTRQNRAGFELLHDAVWILGQESSAVR